MNSPALVRCAAPLPLWQAQRCAQLQSPHGLWCAQHAPRPPLRSTADAPFTRRKQHKKDQVSEVARKKRRAASKATARAIVGVSLEVINKRRAEKPEVRQAGREQAIREIKERAKKAKAERAKATAKAPAGKQAAPAAKNIGRGKR